MNGGSADTETGASEGLVPVRAGWLAAPHPGRLPQGHPHRAEILCRHAEAIAANRPVYADPTSGLSVFTALFLRTRDHCCDSGCRHCPFIGAS